MYYFDLKNEKIYYKKYPKEKYKPMKDVIRIPQDLYQEFTELRIMIPIKEKGFKIYVQFTNKLENKNSNQHRIVLI